LTHGVNVTKNISSQVFKCFLNILGVSGAYCLTTKS
jgi:hypothetical protein